MLVENFIEAFNREIEKLALIEALSQDWLINGDYNGSSSLHARMWAALIKASPDGYIPLCEYALSGDYKPDLTIASYREGSEVINLDMVVEYESTNSSDERVVAKDIRKMLNYVHSWLGSEEHQDYIPQSLVIITSLPSQPAKKYPWYPYNQQEDIRTASGVKLICGPGEKNKEKRDQSPLLYYLETWKKQFALTQKKLDSWNSGSKIYWYNISNISKGAERIA